MWSMPTSHCSANTKVQSNATSKHMFHKSMLYLQRPMPECCKLPCSGRYSIACMSELSSSRCVLVRTSTASWYASEGSCGLCDVVRLITVTSWECTKTVDASPSGSNCCTMPVLESLGLLSAQTRNWVMYELPADS